MFEEKKEKEKTFKEILESKEYAAANAQLQKDINDPRIWNPDPVDYTVFKHSFRDLEKLYTLKYRNKEERKKYYGKDAHKYLNIPKYQIKVIR